MVVLFAAIFTTLSVIEDRHRGFLQAVRAGPGSTGALVLARCSVPRASRSRRPPSSSPSPGGRVPLRLVRWPLLLAALALAAVALAAVASRWPGRWTTCRLPRHPDDAARAALGGLRGDVPPSPEQPVLSAAMRANPVAWAVSAARRALAGPEAPGALPALPAESSPRSGSSRSPRSRWQSSPPAGAAARDARRRPPSVNAALNGTSAVLVLAGWVAIRRGRRDVHRALMLAAVSASASSSSPT